MWEMRACNSLLLVERVRERARTRLKKTTPGGIVTPNAYTHTGPTLALASYYAASG